MLLLNHKSLTQTVLNNSVVKTQLVVQDPYSTELLSVPINQLSCIVFRDNSLLEFTTQFGLGVEDRNLQYGKVYIEELENAPGYYGVRLRVVGIGSWRVVVQHTVTGSGVDWDMTVVNQPISSICGSCGSNGSTLTSNGVVVSYNRPCSC